MLDKERGIWYPVNNPNRSAYVCYANIGKEKRMKTIEQRRMTAACYCRLSDDDDQDGTSISIETQKKILSDYCGQNGIQIYDFYTDDGYTGTNFNRPAFRRMMQDAETEMINTIVVKDLSRFGRNHVKVGNYLDEVLPNMGIRFIAVGDNVDSARVDFDYDLMIPIKNVFNEYYPADCSRKTRQALKAKAANGEYIAARAPYGYRKSREDKHILEIDEITAPIVVEIFEMAAYQGYGYDKIARVLTERKITTPMAYQAQCEGKSYKKNPCEWNLTTVYNMVRNQTYLGHCVNGKRRVASYKNKKVLKQSEDQWIVVENMFPPLISEQLWKDAHERLKTRKHESTTGFVNIFAGLLKCDRCGKNLGISNTKDHTNYYVCNTYKKKGPSQCTSHYLPYDELYGAVLNDIQQVLHEVHYNREEFMKRVLEKISDDDGSQKQQMEREIADLVRRIEELSVKYDRLYDDRLDGLLSDRKFKELAERCEAEQGRAEERLAELKDKLSSQDDTEQGLEQFVEIAEQYGEITALDKEMLNRLIASITIGDRIKTDRVTSQEITVNYKFIGTM